MKRIAFTILILLLAVSLLASCGGGETPDETTAADTPMETTGRLDDGVGYEEETDDESSGNGGEVIDTSPTKDPVITGDSDLEDPYSTVTEEPTLPTYPDDPETSEWVSLEETSEPETESSPSDYE